MPSNLFRRLLPSSLILLLLFSSRSLQAATLSGHVSDETNAAVPEARVFIRALQRGTKAGQDGSYKLENIPSGVYAVEVSRLGYGTQVKNVDLSKEDQDLPITLNSTALTGTAITITAKSEASSTLTTPASVSVVEGRQMDRNRSESLVHAIQDQPGVSFIGEGQTVAKPIIRGLNSQEIVIIEDGVRSEAEQWGNEHAPEIDPLGTSRIEVMRGPNSLLYGSDAIAGVISISHPELPNSNLGDGPMRGNFNAMVNSNNRSVGENVDISGAKGDWGYRANMSQLQAGNFHTPQIGEVPNTGEKLVNGSVEIGERKDWGDLNASFDSYNKRVELQNPNNPFPPRANLTDSEFQSLQHQHGKVHADILSTPARFDITAGYDWLDRKEYDSPDVDTTQTDGSGNSPNVVPPPSPHLRWVEANYSIDGKAHLAPMGPLQGTLGVSGLRRTDNSSEGIVHLTPSYNEYSAGEYLVEDAPLGDFDFSGGVRGDETQYNIQQDNTIGLDFSNGLTSPMDQRPVAAQTLHYSALTGAFGAVYHVTKPFAIAANVGRGYRNPVPFELFAFGKHEGTGTFEIGNPNLKAETSLNTEASVRWESTGLKGEVGVFQNKITNYITSAFTGEKPPADFSDQSIPVVRQIQGDATIRGVDGAVSVAATNWLSFRGVYNMVQGDLSGAAALAGLPTSDTPHVPADNGLVGVDFHTKSWGPVAHPYFGVDEKITAAQKRIFGAEIPSSGYSLTDLHTGGEIVVGGNRMTVDAGVENLFNRGYIDFNSILKEFNIQDPGRNIYAKLAVSFGS